MIIKFGAQIPVYVVDIGHAIIRTLQKGLGSHWGRGVWYKTIKRVFFLFVFFVL